MTANYFQQSAGLFQFVSDSLDSWGIEGGANTQLSALSTLMLAQAQEAFLIKATDSKMKDGTLAKLAMQASTFYNAAFDTLKELKLLDKYWMSYLQVKIAYIKAKGHYYRGLECSAQATYGQGISWLQSSQASCKVY
jgi:programmed cell death 6-interacting protein